MRSPKPISCKCITYGRVDLLEESLQSFLIQDYDGDSEMVIVNDYPLQKLFFDHPKVKIFNLDYTFDSIGDKENFAVSRCKYEIVSVWDDDDIALKNHLKNIDKYFEEDSDLLHWQKGVFFNDGRITSITGLGNSGIVYSKRIWDKLGGHPRENAGYDMTFVLRVKANSKKIVYASPPDEEVSWFYYWANRSYHMSGLGSDREDRPNVIKRHSDHIESLRKLGIIPVGEIELKPRWRLNYDELLLSHLSRKTE